MIAVQNLSKRFGQQEVIRGLSFCALPGAITLLVGGNGIGKTTTMRMLAGLSRPDSGDALLNGRSIVHERSGAQRNFAFLPQGVAFHPRLSCQEVLDFYAGLRGVDRSRSGKMLKQVGLVEHAKKTVSKLSGGLRQRLGLAVLLLADAPILLLDEPGLSLDPEWRGWLKKTLQSEAQRGKTILVTTHLLAEWEGVANRCLLVQKLGIVNELNPARIREEYEFAHSRELIHV
jgi:heme ABC exporter ATP-binding subunit CcmA